VYKDFQAFLGGSAILLGGIGGFLAILDWTLSKKSKDWIENKATTAWIWLSYQQTWPLVRKLQNKRAFAVFLAVGTTLWLVLAMFFAFQFVLWLVPWRTIANAGIKMIALRLIGGMIGLLVFAIPALVVIYVMRERLRQVYSWITTTSGTAELSRRAFGIFGVSAILFFLSPLPLSLVDLQMLIKYPIYTISGALIYFVLSWSLAFICFAMGTLSCYVVGVYILIGLFRFIQALILRIVEYDKGPVLAIAALLAGIGSILTALAH
jgi:hypothetical protein